MRAIKIKNRYILKVAGSNIASNWVANELDDKEDDKVMKSCRRKLILSVAHFR